MADIKLDLYDPYASGGGGNYAPPTFQGASSPSPSPRLYSPGSGYHRPDQPPQMSPPPWTELAPSGPTEMPLAGNWNLPQNTPWWGNHNPTQGGQRVTFPTQGGQTTTQQPFRGVNQSDLMSFFGSYGAPTYDNFRGAVDQAISRGLLPQGSRVLDHPSKLDKVQLPNGQVYDFVQGAGAPGASWAFQLESPHGGGYFSDPFLSQFGSFGMDAIQRLMQPTEMHPILADAIGKLNQMFAGRDAGYQTFRPIADKRLAQLEQPAYTDAQRALIATNFSEPLVASRDAAQERALQRASNRGLGLGSGVLEQEARGIDTDFARMLGEGNRRLAIDEIGLNESRQQEAVQIGQILASLAGQGAGPGLSAASQLAGIGGQLQNEPTERLMQALGVSQNLAMLPGQQMGLALSALNSLNSQPIPQADPNAGLISLLLAMAGQGEGAYTNALGQDSAFWEQLMSAIPGLMGAFGGGGGGGNQYGGIGTQMPMPTVP